MFCKLKKNEFTFSQAKKIKKHELDLSQAIKKLKNMGLCFLQAKKALNR